MQKKQCKKCNHEWLSRVERPLSCPDCKSRNWDVKDYTECAVCKKKFLRIMTHHIDGNKENNNYTNLIKVCSDCHSIIHNGFGRKALSGQSRRYYTNQETKFNINKFRKIWLSKSLEVKKDE